MLVFEEQQFLAVLTVHFENLHSGSQEGTTEIGDTTQFVDTKYRHDVSNSSGHLNSFNIGSPGGLVCSCR